MIWSVVSKKEMSEFGTNPVFRFYREALGKENIKIAAVEEDDPLDFVEKTDTILLRTASDKLIHTIKRKRIVSTAESSWAYDIVRDKEALAKFLRAFGVLTPRQYLHEELTEGKRYFVKPRFGSDSFGISEKSICNTPEEAVKQAESVREQYHLNCIFEEFIEGTDCTVACVRKGNDVITSAIQIECEETGSIQTRECKLGFKEYCSPINDYELTCISRYVFRTLSLNHHARIDFRKGLDGKYYLIDMNLLPGLGPIDHFAKCFLLTRNMSYTDAIRLIVRSAT